MEDVGDERGRMDNRTKASKRSSANMLSSLNGHQDSSEDTGEEDEG